MYTSYALFLESAWRKIPKVEFTFSNREHEDVDHRIVKITKFDVESIILTT